MYLLHVDNNIFTYIIHVPTACRQQYLYIIHVPTACDGWAQFTKRTLLFSAAKKRICFCAAFKKTPSRNADTVTLLS